MSVSSAVSMRTATQLSFPATTIIRSRSRSIPPAASTPMYCLAVDRVIVRSHYSAPPLAGRFSLRIVADGITDRDLARFNHFGVHTTVGVVEIFQKRTGDGLVANAGVRIDIGRGTTLDTLDDLHLRGLPDRQDLIEEIELAPCRPACNIEVAAKAQRIDRRAHGIFHGCDRRQVDYRYDFSGHVRKTMASPSEDLGWPAQFLRHEPAEECFYSQPAFLRPQVGACGLATLRFNGQGMADFVEVRAQ